MITTKIRNDGRTNDLVRPIIVQDYLYGYADGSVLVTVGQTRVLCSATLQAGVPIFMRGKHEGWLTAEYALLPTATHTRTQRVQQGNTAQSGRSVELSRLIGRVLRTVVDMAALGEQTLHIDCDVLHADGGTRTAAISGAMIALWLAQEKLLATKRVVRPFLKNSVAAVSVAIHHDHLIVDPTYQEDSVADADINFVFTADHKIVEIQGGVEHNPIDQQIFLQALAAAQVAVQSWFVIMQPYTQRTAVEQTNNRHHQKHRIVDSIDNHSYDGVKEQKRSVPLFSLYGRNVTIAK